MLKITKWDFDVGFSITVGVMASLKQHFNFYLIESLQQWQYNIFVIGYN